MLVIKQFKKGEETAHYVYGHWIAFTAGNKLRSPSEIASIKRDLEDRLKIPEWVRNNNLKENTSHRRMSYDMLAIVWEPDHNELGEVAP